MNYNLGFGSDIGSNVLARREKERGEENGVLCVCLHEFPINCFYLFNFFFGFLTQKLLL